jgi:hypothetical protein
MERPDKTEVNLKLRVSIYGNKNLALAALEKQLKGVAFVDITKGSFEQYGFCILDVGIKNER